jgi:hypothetical protein
MTGFERSCDSCRSRKTEKTASTPVAMHHDISSNRQNLSIELQHEDASVNLLYVRTRTAVLPILHATSSQISRTGSIVLHSLKGHSDQRQKVDDNLSFPVCLVAALRYDRSLLAATQDSHLKVYSSFAPTASLNSDSRIAFSQLIQNGRGLTFC